jgi:hypothetical protein
MSLPAHRQAAFGVRRLYTVGGMAEVKPTERGGPDAPADRTRGDGTTAVTPEPHWQAAIELATD